MGKHFVGVVIVDTDQIAMLRDDLPVINLGPAEIGYRKT